METSAPLSLSRRRRQSAGAPRDVEPVFQNRSLEKISIRVDWLERVDLPGGAHHVGHLHREEPDVRSEVHRVIAGFEHGPHEADFVDLVAVAHDVQTDHMVGEIDE